MARRMPDLFGSGEVRVLRLETAAGLLSLAVAVLTCMLLWQKLSGLPVCYGTVEAAPGLIVPNEVPESHVRALSEQIALVLYNNTWETAEGCAQAGGAAASPATSGGVHGADGTRTGAHEGTQPEHAAEHPQHGGRQIRVRIRRPRGRGQAGIRGDDAHP